MADCATKRTLLVGYRAADLTRELLSGEVTCHVLDDYQRQMLEQAWPVRVLCTPHLPEGPWDLIRFKTGPKLMSGELALDLLQEISRLKPTHFVLDFVGRERDRQALLDKIRREPTRVRDFHATWPASVPGSPPIFLTSTPGCFCHRRHDEGGLALAEVVSRELRARQVASTAKALRLLDMGCGCGLVGLLVAHAVPPVELVMVDSHARAVEAARENAVHLGLAAETLLSAVGTPPAMDGTFDVFVGNPPYYSDYRIADIFLQTAFRALKPGGVCYTVVKNPQGLQPVQARFFASVEVLRRRGYSVLKSLR